MEGLLLGLGQVGLRAGAGPVGRHCGGTGLGSAGIGSSLATSSFLSLQLEFGDFLVFKYISPFLIPGLIFFFFYLLASTEVNFT